VTATLKVDSVGGEIQKQTTLIGYPSVEHIVEVDLIQVGITHLVLERVSISLLQQFIL
jgi:hypothetical protein